MPKKKQDDFQETVDERVGELLYERCGLTLQQARDNKNTKLMGLAFSEFCIADVLSAFHDLGDADEIEQGLQCDEAGDNGIDFVHHNEDRFFILQMKYKRDGGSLDPAEFDHFLGTDQRIFSPEFARASPSVREMLTGVTPTSAIEYHLVTNGNISDNLKQKLARHREKFGQSPENAKRGPIVWDMLDGNALRQKYEDAPFAEDRFPERISLAVRPLDGAFGAAAPCAIDMTKCLAKAGDRHTSVITVIKGTDIKALYRKEGRNLFHANIRYYLGGNTKVNDELRKTLSGEKPQEFYIFNNGISAICSDMQMRRLTSGGGEIVCEKFQIINGAQTVATIGSFPNDSQLEKVNVLLRITELGDSKNEDELRRLIIHRNNRQTAMGHADFRSNDPIQRFLEHQIQRQKILYRRDPPHAEVVYLRKREFRRQTKRRVSITLSMLAKALYAYQGKKPARLYSASAFLFDTTKDVGEYPKLFWGEDGNELKTWPPKRTLKVIAIAILQIHLGRRLKQKRSPYEKAEGGRNSVAFMTYSMGWQILWGFGIVVRKFHKGQEDKIYRKIVHDNECLTEGGFVSKWLEEIEDIIQDILTYEQEDLEETKGKGATLNFKAWMRNNTKTEKIQRRIERKKPETFPLP